MFDVTGVLGVGRRAQRAEQPNATVTTTATVSMAPASSASTGPLLAKMKTWQRSGRYAANVFVTRHWSVGRRSGAAAGAASGALMLSTGDAESGSAGDVSVAVGSSGAGGSLSLERGVFSLCQGWRRFNREWRWRHRQRCGEHTLTWSTQCTCTKFTCTNLVHTLCNLHVHV